MVFSGRAYIASLLLQQLCALFQKAPPSLSPCVDHRGHQVGDTQSTLLHLGSKENLLRPCWDGRPILHLSIKGPVWECLRRMGEWVWNGPCTTSANMTAVTFYPLHASGLLVCVSCYESHTTGLGRRGKRAGGRGRGGRWLEYAFKSKEPPGDKKQKL